MCFSTDQKENLLPSTLISFHRNCTLAGPSSSDPSGSSRACRIRRMRAEEADHRPPVAERTFPPRRSLDSHMRMSTPWDEWRLCASVEPEMPPPTTRQSYRCPTSRHGSLVGVNDGGADVTPTVGEAGEPRRWARSTADDGRRPRMLWRPVMAEEDDEVGGRRRRRTTKAAATGGRLWGEQTRQGLVPAHLRSVPL